MSTFSRGYYDPNHPAWTPPTNAPAKKVAPAVHPKTHKLVTDFAAALLKKLAKAEKKYGYRDNWRTDEWEAECRAELMRHIDKGDPLDVAAYAAFMWRRGWSTSTLPADGRS